MGIPEIEAKAKSAAVTFLQTHALNIGISLVSFAFGAALARAL
jgi:hypothetical protein